MNTSYSWGLMTETIAIYSATYRSLHVVVIHRNKWQLHGSSWHDAQLIIIIIIIILLKQDDKIQLTNNKIQMAWLTSWLVVG